MGEDIEKGRASVIGKKGLFDREHPRLQIVNESQDDFSSFLKSLVRRFLSFDYLHPIIKKLAILHDRHAYVPGPWVNGEDSDFCFRHVVLGQKSNRKLPACYVYY